MITGGFNGQFDVGPIIGAQPCRLKMKTSGANGQEDPVISINGLAFV